ELALGRVVVEDVDAAERVECEPHERLRVLLLRQVARLHAHHLAALRLDHLDRLRTALRGPLAVLVGDARHLLGAVVALADVATDDLRALAREEESRRPPLPPGASGDDRDLPVESSHRALLSLFRSL